LDLTTADTPSKETMKPLTEKQEAVYQFIDAYIQENKQSPTYREIAEHIDKSTSHAKHFVIALAKKGWILFEPAAHRSIKVVKHD
jgi:SOS-response transcriptional repressor LexA